MDYGFLQFNIVQILKERGISKNKICKDLDIPRTNFNRYCRNDFQRIDAYLVCKLCDYLDIGVGDLISYHKPQKEEEIK
ncbi:MAG: helix-turn-helix transcriptional regulator [Firmicutes bacterium]|nr:helix-turn-helix transcriptional regulator [Bacillota bacterium]